MVDFSRYNPLVSQIDERQARQYAIDRQAQIDEERRQQMIQEKIDRDRRIELEQQALNLREQGIGGNVPAALQLTNEYLRAKQEGNIDRANAIAQFAKTQEAQLQFAQPIAEQRALGTVIGKERGENVALLQDMQAYLPKLEETTKKLSSLGKLATYTMAGQARDSLARQLGMDVPDSAVARTEYISTVDNEILPLLRQTFGAQFTEREGATLRATLGDPNKSPLEKDAVLRAFIKNKRTQIEALKRRTGLYQQSKEKFDENKGADLKSKYGLE